MISEAMQALYEGNRDRAESLLPPDEEQAAQAGYVPAEVAPSVPHDWQAVSLWEFRDLDGVRIGLRVLLAPPDAWIGSPRT